MAAELDPESLASQIAWVGGHADVWRLFDRAESLRAIAAALVEPFRREVTKIAGIESRGFILGTACALELGTGFVPIRKEVGVFPGPKAVTETGSDYRGNRHRLRLQRAALSAGDRVLLVDDWIETGMQAAGAKVLIEDCGATFVGVAAIVDQLPAELAQELMRVHTLVPRALLGSDQ